MARPGQPSGRAHLQRVGHGLARRGPVRPLVSIRSTAPNPAEQTATVSVDVDSQFLGLGDEELYASHELAWLDEGLAVFVSHDLNAYGGSTRLITSDGVDRSTAER